MSETGTGDRGLTPGDIAGGVLDGHAEAVKQAGEAMLKSAKPGARFLLKQVAGAPALVYDLGQVIAAPNHTRAAFGAVGSFLGSVGGGALGGLAGGVNAPIGAAVGSTFGGDLGEQIYDDHKQAIDHDVDATARWMADRWRQIRGQRK